ncbi:IS66 family transposase [Colwellia sp. TT2012]|uniref:IS66 family transposase n=1 Tax=Colwellia sp. TT2012 TaxID=1720342 RepID=UPI0018D20239
MHERRKVNAERKAAYHQKHSAPIMAEIKSWGEIHLANETVEENSGLGKAIRYFIKHYVGLSCVLHRRGCKNRQ